MTKTATTTAAAPKAKRNSQTKEVLKRFSKSPLAMIGTAIFVIFVVLAILAPYICKYSYDEMTVDILSGCSLDHFFGTDKFGRDLFSRILYGGRYSIFMGVVATLLGTAIGMVLGAIAGFFGQVADNVVMRICDIFQAIPGILLSMVISTVLGVGVVNTIIALSIGGIAGNARMMRSLILQVRNSDYIEAAGSINCSSARIIFRHILPNTFGPILVGCTMGIGGTIMQAASLSFLGLGIKAPIPEWGALLNEGKDYFTMYPHLLIFPGLAIGLLSLATCLMGDGLRDAMDPRLKK
ncbi:MAG: ABC transporter permease [Clostridiales bacterium]|nr:ABC transporter permease [Clostridiales bacterium]